MLTIEMGGLRLTRLCFGGGKFEGIGRSLAYRLIERALQLGINIFDSHHRYGISEEVLGDYKEIPSVKVMTKISAYNIDDSEKLVKESLERLGRIPDIYWVSDLDDARLFENSRAVYNRIRGYGCRVGITTESDEMGFKFLQEYPDNKYYMIPYYMGRGQGMVTFAKVLKAQGKHIFVIKPFNDGLLFKGDVHKQTIIANTFEAILNDIQPDVICFGTKDVNHLEETVSIFNDVAGRLINE